MPLQLHNHFFKFNSMKIQCEEGIKEFFIFSTFHTENSHDFIEPPFALVPGGRDFLMSGIRVCATDQGRFFTSKNPEQAPNFEVLLQNRPYLLKVYSRTGSFFDNLVSNARLKCQNPSCFQLLFPAA